MATQATITINDGESTPVAHDFDPAGVLDGVAVYEDRVGGIPVGYPKLTLSVRRPTKGSRAYKVTLKITNPTLEQASSGGTFVPPPTLAFNDLAVVEFMFPERGVPQGRANMLAYVVNALQDAAVVSAVEDLEPVNG